MKKRRKAREIALFTLYKFDVSEENLSECLNDILSMKRYDDEIINFAKRLIATIEKNRETIDRKIQQFSKNWKFERMAIIDRNILRIATSEILFMPDIPEKVSINEAVEIAKTYSSSDSYAFINGILHRIYMDVKNANNRKWVFMRCSFRKYRF